MADDRSRSTVLSQAIGALTGHGIPLVITSADGGPYYFELHGAPIDEDELIAFAAALDDEAVHRAIVGNAGVSG